MRRRKIQISLTMALAAETYCGKRKKGILSSTCMIFFPIPVQRPLSLPGKETTRHENIIFVSASQ